MRVKSKPVTRLLSLIVVMALTGCGPMQIGPDRVGGISVVDRMEIADLLSRYSAAYDANDPAAYANLFAQDGEMVVQGEVYKGRETIRAWAEERRATWTTNVITRHYQTNTLLVRLDGDRVRARSMLLLTYQDKRGTFGSSVRVMATGIYLDELHRTAEGWRFYRREADADIAPDPAFLGAE